ncbi:DUF58 domain-containing protein [Halorubrum laminariae]|uniref:DUF58 domain-containing protein n=1 Tax=Halorubrum laminariae TaxID=1433523 RepID=A0ABD6C0Q4_9EURY|nr:DUF58 domain-containing protein [Halorubrum laminariae]
MDVTERWWALAGSGGLLIVVGVLAEQLRFVFPAAGLGAWLLGVAVVSSESFTHSQQHTAIDYSIATENAFVETDTTVTLRVHRPPATAAVPLSVTIETPPGISIAAGEPTVSLPAGVTESETEVTVAFAVAGQFEFPPAMVTVSDPVGLYQTQYHYTATPQITVRPQSPTLHIGRGGEGLHSAYGQHRSDSPGPGVTTRELREYLPGDDFQQIDWNATARLSETYIRETEGETDRRTVLIVDHRGRMDGGEAGNTMLAYAREVASGIARAAADNGDPLGLRTVGNHGITHTVQPSMTPQTYARVEALLYDLTPTGDTTVPGTRSARQAGRLADRLAADDGQFATVVAPYVTDQTAYTHRLREDPLVNTVQQVGNEVSGDGLLVIVTSDAEPAKLREVVKMAIQSGGQILIFLTPECLFESSDLATLDDTYERYRTFEELRRTLDSHPRVTVLEIAPETRIQTVLAHRQEKPTQVR